jgi:hypothetical protein
MKELYHQKHRKGLKLDGLSHDDRSQAVISNKGVPIISKVNNEDMGIFNNQRFKIVKIGTCTITIEDDFEKLTKINIRSTLKRCFLQLMGVASIHRRACPLVSHTQFMSGMEWTSACYMWPCPVQGHMNILML